MTETSTASVQRALLYVPTYESLVSLGAAYAPDGEAWTQPGFTASTTRHVFLRAGKSVTFQADGHAWFQSNEGAIYTVAGANAYLVGGESVYVGAGGYVGFMAGYAGAPIDAAKDDYSDADPSRPAPVDEIPTAFRAADLSWEITKQLVGLAILAKTWEHKVYLGEHKTLVGALGLLVGTVSTTWSLGSFIYSEATGAPDRTMNFYSEAGLLAGTPTFCTIAGTLGASVRSLNATFLGHVAVTIDACLGATVDTLFGETKVASATSVSARSLLENKLASRLGRLSLLGATVELGGIVPAGFQAPTASISIDALRSVRMVATAPAVGSVAIKASPPVPGAKLEATALGSVEFTSTLNTNVRVISIANVYEIVASPTAISIRSSLGELLSLTPTAITLGPSLGQVQLTPQGANIAAGSFQITPTGITAMSGTLDLL